MVGWFLTTSEVKRAAVRPMARVAGFAALAVAAVTASTASAHDRDHDDDRDGSTRLEVVLNGRIAPVCKLSGGGDIDFGVLDGNEQADASFGLGCNVPFDLSFQSTRGGLAHATKPRGEGPFAGTLGYTLNVAVPTLSPGPGLMSGSFTSQDLMGRKTLSSGEGVAAGGGRIQIRTQVPGGAGLLAGEYSETLTVTVAPRV